MPHQFVQNKFVQEFVAISLLINKLPGPLIISQSIETSGFPPFSYRHRGFTYGRFQ